VELVQIDRAYVPPLEDVRERVEASARQQAARDALAHFGRDTESGARRAMSPPIPRPSAGGVTAPQ
jgi:hypothetical protein